MQVLKKHLNGLTKISYNQLSGEFKTFHNNGLPRVVTKMDLTTKSVNGKFEKFHRNGLCKVITNVVNNEICGHFILLHNHAFVKTTCYFNKNVPSGDFRKYYRNGKTKVEAHFNSYGKLDGVLKYFSPSGHLRYHAIYKNDGSKEMILNESGRPKINIRKLIACVKNVYKDEGTKTAKFDSDDEDDDFVVGKPTDENISDSEEKKYQEFCEAMRLIESCITKANRKFQ